MRKRKESLRPLLQKLQDIDKKAKEDIKRIWGEEMRKIEEIEKMLRTREVEGSEKETLL